jgi:hypothetical protein
MPNAPLGSFFEELEYCENTYRKAEEFTLGETFRATTKKLAREGSRAVLWTGPVQGRADGFDHLEADQPAQSA